MRKSITQDGAGPNLTLGPRLTSPGCDGSQPCVSWHIHWKSTAPYLRFSCPESRTCVWNWGNGRWTWIQCHRHRRGPYPFELLKTQNTGKMEGLFQAAGNGRHMRRKCNAYSWRRSWATGEKPRDATVALKGVCGLGAGVGTEVSFLIWRVAWRLRGRMNVVWEIHSAMFRDDGILCLQLALHRFRDNCVCGGR